VRVYGVLARVVLIIYIFCPDSWGRPLIDLVHYCVTDEHDSLPSLLLHHRREIKQIEARRAVRDGALSTSVCVSARTGT